MISPVSADTSDYWKKEEQSWDIAKKEATALERVLLAFQNQLRNCRLDALLTIRQWFRPGTTKLERVDLLIKR